MQRLIALLAVVLLAFTEAKPMNSEPAFCNGLECPHFKTVNKTANYELRCYKEDYKWASTIVAGAIFYIIPIYFLEIYVSINYYAAFFLRCCVTQFCERVSYRCRFIPISLRIYVSYLLYICFVSHL